MNKKPNVRPQQKSVNPRGNAPKTTRKPQTQSKQAARPQNPQQKIPPKPRNPQPKPAQKPRNPQQKPAQKPRNPQQMSAQKPQNPQPKPAQKPRKPANPKADKAMAAVMRRRNPQKRTKRFRGGNYILYYLLAAVVVIVVLIILSNTVLFKCSRIDVIGNARYKPEEITAVCGIADGDNLLHISTSEAEKNIAAALVYIDSAKVKKLFPTRVEITVTEAEKWYCVEQSGITAAISRGGKVVEQCAPGDYPVVRGMEAESLQTGVWLKSKTEGKTDIPATLLNAADKVGLRDVTSIDVTDKFSVKVVVNGRITLELGSVSGAESKLIIAKSIIDRDVGENDSVTLLLNNPDKVAMHYNTPETPVQSTSSSTSTTSENPGEPEPEAPAEPEDPEPEAPEEPENPDPEDPEDPE